MNILCLLIFLVLVSLQYNKIVKRFGKVTERLFPSGIYIINYFLNIEKKIYMDLWNFVIILGLLEGVKILIMKYREFNVTNFAKFRLCICFGLCSNIFGYSTTQKHRRRR